MKLLSIITTISIIILLAGCSGNQSQITQPQIQVNADASFQVGVTDKFADNSPAGGVGMLGLFNLNIDPSNVSADLTSIRTSALTDVLEVVDITNFLQAGVCTDCVQLKSVMLDPDGNLVLSIGIKHPFPAGDILKPISGRNRADLHVFNVEGIVVSNSPVTIFPSINAQVSGMDLINADGFSGYLDSALDDFYPTDATVHPYKTHFDDYSAGNYSEAYPMGFESVTDPPPSGNLIMAMGCDYDFQDYVFQLEESNDFIFAVGCTYAVSSASKAQRFTPEYRVPQHNKKAASEVSIEIITNDLKGEDTLSTAAIEVHVVDVSHGVAVGTALNEMLADSSVGNISIEIPSVTDTPLIIDGNTAISGTGHDAADPLIYEGTITNTLGAAEGTYAGIIKVTDTYLPGQNASPLLNGMDGISRVSPIENPLTALFDITEFATYKTFSIDVAPGKYLTLLLPNGGEEFDGLTQENITWDSMNIPFVDLYYSKDDFVADNNLIIADYPNTGLYDWYVPNDPSTTVKVKVIESGAGIEDESDDYFTIIDVGCNFEATGYSLENSWSITDRWTYMGVKVTNQDPVQRLIFQGYPANDTLFIHNANDPNGAPVATYDTGDLIYCNNNRAFWIDPVSETGIDRIIYNNHGGGSPLIGYQLKTIDWDGSTLSNPQTLPKHGSIWNLCVAPNGDLYSHDAYSTTPHFYRREKANNYALTQLFTLTLATCNFGSVSYIRDIAYDSDNDTIILFCRNTAVSNGGQLYVLNASDGSLFFEDLDIFGGQLIAPHVGVDIDHDNPTCRVVVYAGADSRDGTYWIGRYSSDFTEKMINEYDGLALGPARGELCADGTLWAAWQNSRGVLKFNPPSDW